MQETQNLKLKLPAPEDFYAIEDQNENMRKLDETVAKKAELDPATGKVSFEQLPDIDCGSFDGGTF